MAAAREALEKRFRRVEQAPTYIIPSEKECLIADLEQYTEMAEREDQRHAAREMLEALAAIELEILNAQQLFLNAQYWVHEQSQQLPQSSNRDDQVKLRQLTALRLTLLGAHFDIETRSFDCGSVSDNHVQELKQSTCHSYLRFWNTIERVSEETTTTELTSSYKASK